MFWKRTIIFLCSVLIVGLPFCAFAEETAKVPGTEKEKEAYSVGYQLGLRMNFDGADLDLDTVMQGMKDATSGKDPVISQQEIREIMLDIRERLRQNQMRKSQELRVSNYEESKSFMEENAKLEGVQTTESGLQYKILQEGSGGPPALEDIVTVHYRGTFIDGTQFDNSYEKGKPQTFKTGGVIRGWTEALQMMKENAKWQLFIPPNLAYGNTGLPGSIPPNKVLVFEIELLSIEKQDNSAQDG